MAKSTAKGTRFETALVRHFDSHNYPLARMEKAGSADKGDIRGLFFAGTPVVVEAKVRAKEEKFTIGPWLHEVSAAKSNLGADAGLLIIKRPRVGDVGSSWVVLTALDAEMLDIPVKDKNVKRYPPSAWNSVYEASPMTTTLVSGERIVVVSLDVLLDIVTFDQIGHDLSIIFDNLEKETGHRPDNDVTAASLERMCHNAGFRLSVVDDNQ